MARRCKYKIGLSQLFDLVKVPTIIFGRWYDVFSVHWQFAHNDNCVICWQWVICQGYVLATGASPAQASNTHEKKKMATIDIPRAFLHTETDEDVIMTLVGPLAELMVKIDPKIYPITTTSEEKPHPF